MKPIRVRESIRTGDEENCTSADTRKSPVPGVQFTCAFAIIVAHSEKFLIMKAVKIRYTVKPEFVAQNKANIQKVMNRLKSDPIPGMFYSSFTLEDGHTFV
jgi:hypothetical protein